MRTRGAATRGRSSLRAVRAGGGEHEADAAHRVDVARRGRAAAELLAQAADVDVECLRRAEPVDVPDLVDEPLPCDDGAGAAHEQREQVELLAGRLDRRAGPCHGPRGRVEADVADLDRRVLVGCRGRGGGRGGAAQHGADAGRDLAGAERLDDVVVGAELEPDHAVGLLAAGGQHDDRHLRLAPDLAADVVARAVGEHEVEQDEVGADGRRLLESGGGGAGDLEMEALAREGLGEGLRDGRLVLDQEDRPPAGCHVHIVGGHRDAHAGHTAAPAGGRAPRVRGALGSVVAAATPAAAVAAAVVAGLDAGAVVVVDVVARAVVRAAAAARAAAAVARAAVARAAAAVVVGDAAAAAVVRPAVAVAVVVRVVVAAVVGAAAAVVVDVVVRAVGAAATVVVDVVVRAVIGAAIALPMLVRRRGGRGGRGGWGGLRRWGRGGAGRGGGSPGGRSAACGPGPRRGGP